MTTRAVMVAQYGAGSPTRLAISCAAMASTVVRRMSSCVVATGSVAAAAVGSTALTKSAPWQAAP